jgi:hypothetical protein
MLTELELRMATRGFVMRTIHLLDEAGWALEAQGLADGLAKAERDIPELLTVRENAEHLAAQLEATR